jgi:hypothetical protein
MNKLAVLAFLCIGMAAFGQEIYVGAGRTSSDFEFTNSQGADLQNLQSTSSSYVAFGYTHEILTEGLNIGLGLSYNTYGSIGSDNALGNFFEWNADYLGLNLGLDYDVAEVSKLTLFVKASFSAEFLTKGTQTLNNQVFDLDGLQEFDNTAFFFTGGIGLSYPISPTSKVYAQYQFGQSLALKNDVGGSSSELTINTNMIGIGIAVGIFSDNDKDEEDTEETEDNN